MYNAVASALRSGHRMQPYGIKLRFLSGCSTGVARVVRDTECNPTVLKYDFGRGVAQG